MLPCGAGKTLVGAGAMAAAKATTLILVTNTVSARQWKDELIKRTTLTEDEIGEYSGARKEIRPVTIATYQVLTTRRKGAYTHLDLLDARDWGLVVYDEVHLLPAPIFRMTADLQARRRLGLTATLVREDGREADVFSLIGPKRFDAPWKDIEAQGYIAPADCVEVRVTLPDGQRLAYAIARAGGALPAGVVLRREARRSSRSWPSGIPASRRSSSGSTSTSSTRWPSASAPTSSPERPPSRSGSGSTTRSAGARSPQLVVSKVANFSIDLPEASVAIQISGTFGCRQEEAQRLGRVLRPKGDGRTAHFYTVVSRDTVDADFAAHRQRFLAEQGYSYRIIDAADLD